MKKKKTKTKNKEMHNIGLYIHLNRCVSIYQIFLRVIKKRTSLRLKYRRRKLDAVTD